MGIVTLQNNEIKIEVNTHGAELVSLKRVGVAKENMWCGDSKYWGRVSPVLFPFVGKLEEQTYRYKGKEFTQIPQHGFARDSEFELTEQNEDTIWFRLIKNETWAEKYPFDFTFRIGYKVEGSSVHVMWNVTNDGEDKLHFSIGAHPAFACEGGLEGYSLDLHTNMTKIECGIITDKGVLGNDTKNVELVDGVLRLSDELFDLDALIMDGAGINTVTLIDKEDVPVLQLRFGTPQLGIWSPAKAKAPFVCIEPWYGRCDREGFKGDLSEREFGNSIERGHSFNKEYVIELL